MTSARKTFLNRNDRLCGERGSVQVFWLILVPAAVMMIGLSFDGGQILAARRQAADHAQQAAVAGTQGLDETSTRQGLTQLDAGLVAVEVNGYLTLVGATGTHTSTATTVTVTVTEAVDMQILTMIGISSKTVTGTATARVVRGVEGPDT